MPAPPTEFDENDHAPKTKKLRGDYFPAAYNNFKVDMSNPRTTHERGLLAHLTLHQHIMLQTPELRAEGFTFLAARWRDYLNTMVCVPIADYEYQVAIEFSRHCMKEPSEPPDVRGKLLWWLSYLDGARAGPRAELRSLC